MSFGSGKKIVLNSSQIKLGDKKATESLILGDSFIQQFSNLLNSLDVLCSALEKEPILVVTPTVAGITKESIKNIKSTLENLKSDTVKTI